MIQADSGSSVLSRKVMFCAAVSGGLGAAGMLVGIPSGLPIALAGALSCFLVLFALRSPRFVIVALAGWFVALGLARRLILGVSPKDAYGDPLLLVGPATWAVLTVLALRRGAFSDRGALTRAVLALMVILAFSALNPLQGGLTVGLGGVLLVVVPMAAFFVGRSLVDDRLLERLLVLVAWLGTIVAAYGLCQTFIGFPSWDDRWIAQQSNVSLNVGGVIRAFASFSAASEYASFLGMAIVVWVALARGLGRTSFGLIALALLGTAMWFESARGIIVLTVVAVGAVLAARAGLTLWRGVFLGLMVLLLLPLVIGWLAPGQFSDDAAGGLSRHQVEGLSDPFGEGSTLPVHVDSMVGGFTGAVDNPLGVGVGAVTISGQKYGGTVKQTEADPSNVAVAAGFPGFFAYLAVVLLALPRMYRQAVRRRDPPSLAGLGIVVVTSLQWLNGGHYATAFWPWLILGWSDARSSRSSAASAPVDADELEVPS